MTARLRTLAALSLALLLAPASLARADQAYDRVAAAYAQAGGQLDACAFTQAQLEAGLAGIPPEIKRYVPDLRRAIKNGIATHVRGDCAGRTPGTTTTPPVAGAGGAIPTPEVSTTPPASGETTPPVTTQPAATPPVTTTSPGPRHHDTTPLAIALAALGAFLLLLLALWGWARARGWDPPGAARARHAWGEAGHRTTSTWLEFTDWLRLGR